MGSKLPKYSTAKLCVTQYIKLTTMHSYCMLLCMQMYTYILHITMYAHSYAIK